MRFALMNTTITATSKHITRCSNIVVKISQKYKNDNAAVTKSHVCALLCMTPPLPFQKRLNKATSLHGNFRSTRNSVMPVSLKRFLRTHNHHQRKSLDTATTLYKNINIQKKIGNAVVTKMHVCALCAPEKNISTGCRNLVVQEPKKYTKIDNAVISIMYVGTLCEVEERNWMKQPCQIRI